MKTLSLRFVLSTIVLTAVSGSTIEAGVIPWTYNAVFGYGPIFPQRYGYTLGYSPLYGQSGPWMGNVGSYGSYYGGPSMWSPSMTSYYGPSYYGGGFVSSSCGCSPCAVSSCSPCGTGCASGDCSTGTATYSPDPAKTDNTVGGEVTPTFRPVSPDEPTVAEPNDDFVPVEVRDRQGDFLPPSRTNPENIGSTIPRDRGNSTITNTPGSTNLLDIDNSAFPMPEINRSESVTPASGIGAFPNSGTSTIPANPGSTIPSNAGSTIPENRAPSGNLESVTPENSTIPERRPFPGSDSPAPIFNPNFRPAPIDPAGSEDDIVIPGSTAVPIEIDSGSASPLVVQRQRVSIRAGYRTPQVSRPEVTPMPVLQSGEPNLAVR